MARHRALSLLHNIPPQLAPQSGQAVRYRKNYSEKTAQLVSFCAVENTCFLVLLPQKEKKDRKKEFRQKKFFHKSLLPRKMFILFLVPPCKSSLIGR